MITSNKAISDYEKCPDPDARLMLRVRDGNDHAFEQLVMRYERKIDHWLGRSLDRQEREDLTQDVFLRVYRARETYEPRSRFSTWLYAIVKNVAVNRQVSVRNRFERSVARTGASQVDAPEKLRSNFSEIERQELSEILENALESLSPRQKQAILLYHYRQVSYAKIAEVLDTTTDAVKSLLHRARNNLKEALVKKNRLEQVQDYLETHAC